MARIHCGAGHTDPISCRPPREHPTQGVSESGFSFFLWGRLHESALPFRVPIIPIARWDRRIFCPLPCFRGCMCRSSMAKAARECFQLLLRVISSEEAIRAGITKVAGRLPFREQSIVERAIIVVSRLISRNLMHSLESLGVNSTAKATRSCQRRGFGFAVGTHRLGHCASRVALRFGEGQACGTKSSSLTCII